MTISAHVMVKNEYQYLWYAVMSIIHHVDRVRLWDTGSSDGTIEIINELLKTDIGKQKIFFESHPLSPFDEEQVRQDMLHATEIHSKMSPLKSFQKARKEMLSITTANWFIVVDGDEIWWEDSIKKLTSFIRTEGDSYESIVVPTINTVGDMYHFQEKEAGNYHLAGKVGHYNLRAVNRAIPGLNSKGAHGVWGWADGSGKQIQDRNPKKIKYLDAPYLHCTFLERAHSRYEDKNVVKRAQKFKHEIGISFPGDFYYPEVFFRNKPNIVSSVWKPMDIQFKSRAFIETPLRKVKRRVLPKKIGY